MTKSENEVMRCFQSLEDEYWKAFDSGATESLERIIHRQIFLGCTSTGIPLSRDALLEKVAANKGKPHPDSSIELLEHIVIGNAAITLVSRNDGSEKKVITHTWIGEGEQWTMIGGMSQNL